MEFNFCEKQYATIRQAAQIVGVPHSRIREWLRAGDVPGFYSGSRFYVNVERFREKLEAGEIGAQPQRSGDTDGEDGGSGGRFCGGDQPRPSEGGKGSVNIIGRG